MTVEGSTSNFYNHWQGRVPPPTPSLWEQFKDALTSNQNFEYLYWIQVGMSVAFDYTMRLLGPCLIVLAVGLLSSVTYLYFIVLLPLLLGPQVGPAHVLHGAFALLLLVNVFFNYLLCVSTSPGSPRQPCDRQTADLMEANRQGGLTMDPRSWSYCKKCRVPRPPRAHHCHVCKKCVLNMDHHCPWVSNCVGYYNYRYFVLFLMWLWAACLYGVLLLLSPFIALMTNARQFSPIGGIASERSAVLFTFVLALSVGIALSALLGWHVYLIFTAQTTIEFYVNKARREKARHRGQLYNNPYDLGWVRNWESVFGKMPWYLAVLPSRRPPPDMSFEAETAMLMGRDLASVV